MEWQDIRTALSRMAPPFPLAAAREARRRWDELAPFFVTELERVAAGGSTLLDDIDREYDGLFSFAVYLAAEKRDSRAYRPLALAGHGSSERAVPASPKSTSFNPPTAPTRPAKIAFIICVRHASTPTPPSATFNPCS